MKYVSIWELYNKHMIWSWWKRKRTDLCVDLAWLMVHLQIRKESQSFYWNSACLLWWRRLYRRKFILFMRWRIIEYPSSLKITKYYIINSDLNEWISLKFDGYLKTFFFFLRLLTDFDLFFVLKEVYWFYF